MLYSYMIFLNRFLQNTIKIYELFFFSKDNYLILDHKKMHFHARRSHIINIGRSNVSLSRHYLDIISTPLPAENWNLFGG